MVENPPLPASLADAVSVFRGNPFTDNAVASRARLGRLLLTPPAARAFRGALRGSAPFGAEDLVLAVAHARASALLEPRRVFGPDVVPDDVLAQLPRSRHDYASMGFAAARTFRALQAAPGPSSALCNLRRRGWASAFGASLIDALDTELLRRGQPVVICGEAGSGRRTLARAVLSGVPAPGDRPPWTAPVIAPWDPAAPPQTSTGGLIVGGLLQRTPVELAELEAALDRGPGPRLAITCGPWATVAGHLPRALAARLAPLRLELVPLRDRLEDLDALATSRLVTWGRDLRAAGSPGLDHGPVLSWFQGAHARHHDWPGNQAELEGAVRALLLGGQPALPAPTRSAPDSSEPLPGGLAQGTWSDRQVRDWYLQRVHGATGRIGRTARILGLDRSTVRLRLRQAGLS